MSAPSAGPIEQRPSGQLRRALDPHDDGHPRDDASRAAAWLRGVLADAGVTLGAYDERIVDYLAADEPETVQTIAGWVRRAGGQP